MKSIDRWFPTLIFRETLDDYKKHNNYLKEKAHNLKIQNQNKVKTLWNCDTFNTLENYNPFLDNDPVVLNLIEICKFKVLEFSHEYGVQKNFVDLQCDDFWFNIASFGQYQEYHNHSNSHFSLVYYVSTPDNCGNLVFQSLESITDMFALPLSKEKISFASLKSCSYEPKESNLIIFRSNLLHMVHKNLNQEDRISISMNFSFY